MVEERRTILLGPTKFEIYPENASGKIDPANDLIQKFGIGHAGHGPRLVLRAQIDLLPGERIKNVRCHYNHGGAFGESLMVVLYRTIVVGGGVIGEPMGGLDITAPGSGVQEYVLAGSSLESILHDAMIDGSPLPEGSTLLFHVDLVFPESFSQGDREVSLVEVEVAR